MLLDTCTFIWLIQESSSLSKKCTDLISDGNNTIYLSIVSAWEMITKYQIGKLTLSASPEIIIPNECHLRDIKILELGRLDIFQLVKLPTIHKDPFDRMLICQALQEGIPILTPDKSITQYNVPTIW